jgi:L,D-peptidoglycan transpeptidase YkuD (ErfK/YbiS/YcfS/YnhG family)
MKEAKSIYRKPVLIVFLLIITMGAIWAFVNVFRHKPPVEKMEAGRILIARAISAEANIYAPEELALAEQFWQEAMAEWNLANGQSPMLRNFAEASSKADLAVEKAKIAIQKAEEKKEDLQKSIKPEIAALKKTFTYLEYAISLFPLNNDIRTRVTSAAITLNEAEMAYSRQDYLMATEKMAAIKTTTVHLEEQTRRLLVAYFTSYNHWLSLNEEMKAWSKKTKAVSMVVDKFSRKCTVYKSGKKYKEFEVELGINWLGDKNQSGDRTTPEGRYKVSRKRSGNKTLYHKSLEINYPNEEDQQRFEQLKRDGLIPDKARIGGAIALHGGGGRGIDWTEGCIAFENKDMDVLFSQCPVGTPVAIVGSLVPLDKIFEDF